MGSGKNGSFDKTPDWQQWGILLVDDREVTAGNDSSNNITKTLFGQFIFNWLKLFSTEQWTVILEPIEGHGTWDHQNPFGVNHRRTGYNGPVAILTRATIRWSKLKAFWSNVPAVAASGLHADGLLLSLGIGEAPFIKQATFSVWQSMDAMKEFAYQRVEHRKVIQKTRSENWYKEEMFVRFIPLKSFGSIRNCNPLEGKL